MSLVHLPMKLRLTKVLITYRYIIQSEKDIEMYAKDTQNIL